MTVDNQTNNEKTPEGVSSPDKYLYLDNIINEYEIRHPKPSISRNTAKKMLLRDVRQFLAQAEVRGRLKEAKRFVLGVDAGVVQARIAELEASLEERKTDEQESNM